MAEYEAALIGERTQAGLQAARAQGGRKPKLLGPLSSPTRTRSAYGSWRRRMDRAAHRPVPRRLGRPRCPHRRRGHHRMPTDHHPRDVRCPPRHRHHTLPRHRPINSHLNTRSCTEPPRRPGNFRQLCLGIRENPLLGRLPAAIYGWGSHARTYRRRFTRGTFPSHARAAQISPIIALMALVALGLPDDPVHAGGRCVWSSATVRPFIRFR